MKNTTPAEQFPPIFKFIATKKNGFNDSYDTEIEIQNILAITGNTSATFDNFNLDLNIDVTAPVPGQPVPNSFTFNVVTDFEDYGQTASDEDVAVANLNFLSIGLPKIKLGTVLIKKGKYPPPSNAIPPGLISFDDYSIKKLEIGRFGNDLKIKVTFLKKILAIPNLQLSSSSPLQNGKNDFYFFENDVDTGPEFFVDFTVNNYFNNPNTIVLGGFIESTKAKKWLRFQWGE